MTRSERIEMLDAFKGLSRVVVLAPHPDDESLACGALLAQAFAGSGAHVICLTDGSASHPKSQRWSSTQIAKTRKIELAGAIECLGGSAADLTWVGLTDARLYQADPIAVAVHLAQAIADDGAEHVFAPSPHDHHEDHRATATIAQEIRRLRPEWRFYSYPVWSRWDDPDFDCSIVQYAPYFLESAKWQRQKRAAIMAHQSQLGMLVTDDPDGFVLRPEFIEKFITEDEVFWRMS